MSAAVDTPSPLSYARLLDSITDATARQALALRALAGGRRLTFGAGPSEPPPAASPLTAADCLRGLPGGPLFRGAEEICRDHYLCTYVSGLVSRERTVVARVTRYGRSTFVDFLLDRLPDGRGGDIPDALVDEAIRFGLSLELARRAA